MKQYDRIKMTDGRSGTIVEIYGDQESFDVDIGSSADDWDTITIRRDQIESVIDSK